MSTQETSEDFLSRLFGMPCRDITYTWCSNHKEKLPDFSPREYRGTLSFCTVFKDSTLEDLVKRGGSIKMYSNELSLDRSLLEVCAFVFRGKESEMFLESLK